MFARGPVVSAFASAVLTAAAAGRAEGFRGATNVWLEVALRNGDEILGRPWEPHLRLTTSFAAFDLPWTQVVSVAPSPYEQAMSVSLRNGDRLSGSVGAEVVSIAVGGDRVQVRSSDVRSVAVGADDAGRVEDAERDLALHYTFDRDGERFVWDDSTNGVHGFATGEVTYEASIRGQAIRLKGDGSVVCPSVRLNPHGWRGATVSAWFLLARSSPVAWVISRQDAGEALKGGFRMAVGGVDRVGRFSVQTVGGGEFHVATRAAASDVAQAGERGAWCHVAATFNGRVLRQYVNGVLERTQQLPEGATGLSDGRRGRLIVALRDDDGQAPGVESASPDGLVDEVRIYRRGLSAIEVRALYRQVAGRAPAALQHPDDIATIRSGRSGGP